ncbi:MAG: phosphoribosylaminoimidazolesuccinocarboxamide synthase [Candidatus Levybacteria bacterium]|nr:phosphoribosylaminoimidazolesuccinocarboxamide synthase [Candidatus Levybacteria bacterium]
MIDQKTIIKNIPNSLETVNLPKSFGTKKQGKVRDYYILKNSPRGEAGKRIIITTDRQSAFDRILGLIPFKGQVLTEISEFWFSKTKDIVPNHLIFTPDPNVMIVKNCEVIPIEMVVRGYISGVTSTSIWTAYQKGERIIYGIKFPESLKKNQKLKKPVITPTTKAEVGHDERLTRAEIIKKKIIPEKLYGQMEKAALKLFARGSKICSKAGIILVDTKYEFGLYNNKLMLIDEIHTPDSSRFWIKATYKKRLSEGLEPENFDKEFMRIWFKEQGYTGDPSASSGQVPKIPKMPQDFIAKISERYQAVYEKITGKKFKFDNSISIQDRIIKNLAKVSNYN